MTFVRVNLLRIAAVFMMLGIAGAADQAPVLHPNNERKPAPNFVLKNAADTTVRMEGYRGKVVLLDFWATWCTGCKMEIPWFTEFQKTYWPKGFAVVGVSMDDGGWGVLRPFLEHAKIPYEMVLGNDAMAQQYGVKTLPDTFLIDRKGRVASAYMARLVDRVDIEAKIKALLAEQ